MKTVKLVLTALLAVLFVSGCSQEEQQDILSRLDTLEKVTIASIQGQLTTINGTIGSLQGTQTQLSGYVTSLQTTVGGLQGDYSSLQSLVNSLKEKDDSFAGELKSLKDYIDQYDGDVKAWVEKSYTSLEKFNTLQETVSGINTSITTINGRLDALDSSTQKIAADLKEKTDTLTNRLSRSQIEIEGIKSDLKKLQDEMDSVKEQMAAIVSAVQSVVVVPDYSDGSVKMTGGAENPLRFEVYPLEAAKNLAALGASALSLDCVETKTKSSIFTNIPISGVSFDGEVLQVVANGSNLPGAVKSGDTAINARLRISDGTVTRSSEYFFLKYKETNDNLNDNQQFEIRYTTTNGSMVDIKDYTHIVNHYTDNESGENVIVLDIAQVPDNVFRNDNVYQNNSSLNTVSISAGIRHIASDAFNGCSSLTSVTIPESVISIGKYAFGYCSSLTSITIPESVTSIEYGAFYRCSSLTSVTIPGSVTSIGNNAFAGCTSLTSITIPGSVTSIEYGAFSNCSSLTSITIPEGVTSIGSCAFQSCTSLKEIIVLCSTPPSIIDPFGDTNNAPIYFPIESWEAYKTAWSMYANRISQNIVVDLGLSVMWAKCNLGAIKPEDYGDYYAWGETEPKSDYSWSTYKWCSGSAYTLTKYNTQNSYGTVDNKTVLAQEDEVAQVKFGGKWRMPTDAEWTELIEKCTWTWVTNYNGTGINGRLVTATNGNSIFLPAVGILQGTMHSHPTAGFYWSSSLNTDYPSCASNFYLSSDYFYMVTNSRSYGMSVRPVYSGPVIPYSNVVINEVCGVIGYRGVELYNPNDTEVNLNGTSLFKNGEEFACWTGTADDKIAAKGFFVIAGKKDTAEIDAVANAIPASASFSSQKSLLLELKDAGGKVISTFDRGWKVNGNQEVALEPVEYSFSLSADGGSTWRLKEITMGFSNNNAADKGEIPTAAY